MLSHKSILIVDDEKNIRFMLSECLASMETPIETAEDGETALRKIREGEFGLVLLDLRMPGMDGMEVLRQIQELRPDIRVVILTAHGAIDTAVEAIRLGAVAFLQKPFVPDEIRETVLRVMAPENMISSQAAAYASAVDHARKCMGQRQYDAAFEHLRKALFLDHTKPNAYNLMGIVMELKRDFDQARKHYRAAVSIDPTYQPAMKNLERVTSWRKSGTIFWGLEAGEKSPAEKKRTSNKTEETAP